MKMFKKGLWLLVALVFLGGCSNGVETPTNTNKATEVSTTVEATFPVTVTNYDGKALEIKEKPVRIASLILGTDEMVLEMAEDDRIVGLSGKTADNKAVSNVAEKASKFPKMENNLEVILKSKPDLIVGSSWVKKELLAELKDAGIPYYGYKTPNTIDEQKQIILDLAKIIGEDAKGKAIVADIDTRIAKVAELTKGIKDEDKVRVMPYTMHGSTNAKGTIVDEVFTKAGVINAATEAGLEKRAKISKEKLIEINPDAIMVLAWAKDDLKEFKAFVEDLKNDESLKDVKAIKNGKVYMASSRYMTTVSHNIVEGVEYVQQTIYPELNK